jgi:DNA processing protein
VRSCTSCLRQAQLLKALTPDLDRRPPGDRPPEVLTLLDDELVAAVRGTRSPPPDALRWSEDELLSNAHHDELEHGVEAICRHDEAYPARLLDLDSPPAVLHVLGGLPRLEAVLGPAGGRETVSIVGSRRAPADAITNAHRFAEAFARWGRVVVSGMAFGVDAAAHEGALVALRAGRRAGDRPPATTVAVLSGGVETPSPAGNRRLYERIARQGVVVGELPPGATPRRWSFPARNRLIAALGDALVVVVAAEGSGSLRSVEHAIEIERPIGILPGPLLDPAYAGSNAVLRDDAHKVRPLIVPDDLRTLLGEQHLNMDRPIQPVDPLAGLQGRAREIAEALQAGPRTIESLIAERDPSAILAGLGELEAGGRLRRALSGELELLPPGAL